MKETRFYIGLGIDVSKKKLMLLNIHTDYEKCKTSSTRNNMETAVFEIGPNFRYDMRNWLIIQDVSLDEAHAIIEQFIYKMQFFRKTL